jgi:hypothetical protein
VLKKIVSIRRECARRWRGPAARFRRVRLCLAKNEIPQLARPETAALAAALNCPQKAALLEDCFTTISAKIPGEKAGTRGRHRGGVYDAVQAIAAHAGMPRLYRFFEGWMKSDLDWDEDNVEIVKAYRRNNA